jgi:hypothetical protein
MPVSKHLPRTTTSPSPAIPEPRSAALASPLVPITDVAGLICAVWDPDRAGAPDRVRVGQGAHLECPRRADRHGVPPRNLQGDLEVQLLLGVRGAGRAWRERCGGRRMRFPRGRSERDGDWLRESLMSDTDSSPRIVVGS